MMMTLIPCRIRNFRFCRWQNRPELNSNIFHEDFFIFGCLDVWIVSPNLCVINIDRVWDSGSPWKSIKVGVKSELWVSRPSAPLSAGSGLGAALYVIVSVR